MDGELIPDDHNVDFVIEDSDLPLVSDSGDIGSPIMDIPLICITNDDLPPIIYISEEDLPETLQIDEKDLPEILRITMKDLPDFVRIGIQDLPPDRDLTNVTMECYHGTSMEAAKSIKINGFKVGPGNAYGSGIYFSVGGMSIAQGYLKGTPCIIKAQVDWGSVAYLDDSKTSSTLGFQGGDAKTDKALSLGYDSFLSSSKYSNQTPAIGVVLGKQGAFIKPPRITVLELIDPRKKNHV